jgi:hypothetical protein
MDNVFQNYDGQNWKRKELIIILNQDDMDQNLWKQRAMRSREVIIYQLPEKMTLGECLNYGVKKSRFGIVAKFDDDDYYAPNYLTRQMEAMNNTNADVVCKRKVFMYFEKDKTLAVHLPEIGNKKFITTCSGIKGATLVFKKKIFEKVKFPALNCGEDTIFISNCIKKNYKVYVTDKYNYVCLRRKVPGHHTWIIKDDTLMKESRFVWKADHYKSLVAK